MTSFRPLTSRRLRWLLGAAIAAGFMTPVAAQSAVHAASGCGKCYTLSIATTGTPAPGENALYTGTLTNTSDPGPGHQLGAANITWSPSSFFWKVTAGSVSVSPSGSSTPPTEAVNGGTIELRQLNAAPDAVVTFTFHAIALRGGSVTWSSTAKQSNDYNGIGNDLTLSGSSPTTSVSNSCSGLLAFNAYGCAGIPIATGGTVCTGSLDDSGAPSKVTACITLPPVPGASGFQLVALRTYLGGEGCPVSPVDCTWTTQLLTKLSPVYDIAHSATITTDCTTICGTVSLYFQQNEATGITEPLLLCLPISPIASPLSGSEACETVDGDGNVVAKFVTAVNDYKVMGIAFG